MPLPGPSPKAKSEKRFRGVPTHEWVEVENVPFDGGLVLPKTRADGRPWGRRTRDKWETWRRLPHAKLWGPAEWDFALDTIELAALVHDGEPRHATELRNREKVLGTTLDYLRALRIRYVDAHVGDTPAGVTNIADYRDL